ncbi:hypothetical protein U0070_021815 [Myodes glareolus]|uniref:G-protein coupled receptors family 1 profile domain-containing protein n=1 Tax=Myodes glareolus TaxID=447135 RepID=A0AAW0HP52_MYOGA
MESKSESNGTAVTEFILLGLVESTGLQPAIFVIFFFAYLLTVGGNLSILAAVLVEPKLHTPMYFFLGNLSMLDVGCISVTVPSMLGRLLTHKRSVPYGACLTQLFFFHQLAGVDCFLLTAMAYDRFLAICRPLTYSTRMNHTVQRVLVATSWTCAFSNALTHTVAISTLDFCGPNVINHFYCDLPQLFQLSCSSTQLNELLLFGLGVLMAGAPVILIVTSYIHVAAAVLRIRSSEGRKKAFSTCGSHLTVVGIFYGTGVFSYMRLGSVEASDKDKGIGILNTVISPMLNPLIYSLRNPDVQEELMQPKPRGNGTTVTEFILLGLVETPELWPLVFILFFLAYMTTVGGNLSILAAVLVEPKLHTPMYFFLGNLSVMDVGCISVTIPCMLVRLLAHKRTIPYGDCLTQLFFFHLLVGVDCFLLTAMAYDRFLAICRPLTYSTRMNHTVQKILVATSWACAFSNALTHTVAISTLDFCGPNVINHFYCDLPQLFQLSCSSTQLNELLLFAVGFIMAGTPMALIFTSYIHVAAAVLRIRSAEGRKKAFSTCSSHLTVVAIFYGTGIFNYMRLGSIKLSDKDKAIGIFNTVINPMVNPLIYSLRNPDVQAALWRVFTGRRAAA